MHDSKSILNKCKENLNKIQTIQDVGLKCLKLGKSLIFSIYSVPFRYERERVLRDRK